MKNALIVVRTEIILGMELRAYGDVENPLFLAQDLADHINHTNVSSMVNGLEDGAEKLVSTLFSSGQNRECLFLTEDGVYEILMTSRKPKAKAFRTAFKSFLKAWRLGEIRVVKEPKIPQTYIEALKAIIIIEEEKERLLLENKNIIKHVGEIKGALNNLESDIRVNVNQGIKRLADVYCNTHKITGTNREVVYREIYQTIYTGFCVYYNVNWNDDIVSQRYISTKSGKEVKTKQSYIAIFEKQNLLVPLMEYIISLKVDDIVINTGDLVDVIGEVEEIIDIF